MIKKILTLLFFLLMSGILEASSGVCIQCLYNYNRNYGPGIYFSPQFQAHIPWWQRYGQLRYNNWSYPGVWSPNYPGMHGPSYPGEGRFVAAKPNIYLSGKAGTSFDLKVDLKKGSTLWIASPSLGSGWSGHLDSKQKISVKNTKYPFLYIDYRTEGKTFQYEKGFCAGRAQAIREMLGILKAMGFREIEIKDFLDHWPDKLPQAERFCVFPQENKELGPQMDYLIIPPKHHSVRMNFLVMIDRKEIPKPKMAYRPTTKSLKNDQVFELREWGVTFEIQ